MMSADLLLLYFMLILLLIVLGYSIYYVAMEKIEAIAKWIHDII